MEIKNKCRICKKDKEKNLSLFCKKCEKRLQEDSKKIMNVFKNLKI